MRNPNSTIGSGSHSEDSALVFHNNNQKMISRKRKTKTEVPFLPEELIFKILLLFPVKVLHGVMSIVCQSWYKLIRDPAFIEARRSCSTTSPFCLLTYDSYFRIYSLNTDQITWTHKKTINQVYLAHGDGFILTGIRSGNHYPLILNLVNPSTEQIISLPRLWIGTEGMEGKYIVSCSALTRKYKIVFLKEQELYILTVGVDKEWRRIDISRISNILSLHPGIGHQGLIYCYCRGEKGYLIALDVEREGFRKVHTPKQIINLWEILSGTNLVMNFGTSNCKEFWELVDCKYGGKWEKFGTVDFESKKQEIIKILIMGERDPLYIHGGNIWPVAVLSRDVMLFRFNWFKFKWYSYILAYNFKTEKFSRCFDGSGQSSQWKLMVDYSLDVL